MNLSEPYIKFQVSLIDLSQSDIQVLNGLQIDNGTLLLLLLLLLSLLLYHHQFI